jgi:hypothetical protein
MRGTKLLPLALCASLASGVARAAVDVEIRNGDKVTGTIAPATEVETFRFRVPKDAVLTLKAAAGKKGPQIRMQLSSPAGDPLSAAEGKTASIAKYKTSESGLFSVEITSKDGATGGDYSFSVAWKSATNYGGARTLAADVDDVVDFSVDAGATATFSVKKTKTSAAAPTLASLTLPDATVETLSGATQKRQIDQTGDCRLAVSSATAGDVTTTVRVKPPKASKRRYALTAKAIGGGDPEGDTAFSAIVGPEGGTIEVPTIPHGEPGSQLDGAGVIVPAGALPLGTAVVIATAPAMSAGDAQAAAGTTVAFGPEGLAFGSKTATVTIPFDPALAPVQDQITVYTRNAAGVVKPVPKPYVFDVVAGTVSFATSHFSSFRAFTSATVIPAGDFPTFADVADPRHVCDAFDPNAGSAIWNVVFVAEGAGKTVGALRTTDGTSTTLTHATWVGGGAQTTTPADRAQFQFTADVNTVSAAKDGVLYVGTKTQIFRVDPSTGVVSLFAGTGAVGDTGDGGPAVQATFTNVRNILADLSGSVFVADDGAHRIRLIDASQSFAIAAWAGSGANGIGADGGSVQTTAFVGPSDIAFAPTGGLYVADGARIRHINPFSIPGPVNVTVAGSSNGAPGSAGDGGAPASATFRFVAGISVFVDPARPNIDALVVADEADDVIRLVDFTNASVTLLAGAHGTPGFNGDTGSKPGLLRGPTSVLSKIGVEILCDKGNGRVRAFTYP